MKSTLLLEASAQPSELIPTSLFAVDGLLLRAGVPPDLLSELHGCVYTERCPSCGSSYLRGFDVTATNGTSFRRHSTGRTCDEVAQPGSATSEPTEVASEGSRALDDGKSALDGSSYERNRDEKEEVRGDGDYRRARLSEEPEEPAEAAAHTFEDSGVDRAGEHAEPGSGTPFLEEAAGFLVTAPATDATGAGGNDENEREFRKRERGCKPAPRESTPRHCLEERSVEKERGDRETAGGSKVNRCGSELRDTIVHFGERLDEETLRTAREASKGADLAVVLGTSLKVRVVRRCSHVISKFEGKAAGK